MSDELTSRCCSIPAKVSGTLAVCTVTWSSAHGFLSDEAIDRGTVGYACTAARLGGLERGGGSGDLDGVGDAFALGDARGIRAMEDVSATGGIHYLHSVRRDVADLTSPLRVPTALFASRNYRAEPSWPRKAPYHGFWRGFACHPSGYSVAYDEMVDLGYEFPHAWRILSFDVADYRNAVSVREFKPA